MQDNNTPIFRVSLANGASRDYTEQEYRDLHIADWLNENHSGKYNVFRLNDAPADSITKDQQYVVSFTQDGQTKSKVYSGQDFMNLDMGNWLEQNHPGNYKIQSVRGYSDANLAADEDYWKKKADEQKAAIGQFEQDNHDFMFKHEMDKIVYDAGEGNIVDDNYMENDVKYRGLVAQKQALQAEYSNNPYIKSLYKSEAEYADGKAAEYDSIRKEMHDRNPFISAAKYSMQSGTKEEIDAYKMYGQAKDLARSTAKTFAIETIKAPGESGFVDYMRNYGKGSADVFSDPAFWSRGLTEISRNLNIRDIMKRLQDKGLDLNQLTEKDLDDNLNNAEKALLSEFVRNAYAKATRAADMAPGYTAGRTAAESLGFMAEFLVTGAIGRGLGAAEEAGATGLKSWIARELRTGSVDAIESSVKRGMINAFTKGGEKALTEGAKKAVVAGSKAASGAYSAVARPLEQAVWHTALQPSTYRQISENLTQIQENGKLIDAGNAIWGGVLDQLVENWSESMGGTVETVLGLPFKAAGWAGNKVLGKTTLGQWGKWLADSQAARVLHDAGFNGLIGEMGEEWLGNAARVGLGLMSGDEFKNFASWHEQLEMAASFAPMSLFGLGTSAYAAAKQAKDYKQTAEAMRGVLNRAGMTEDEIADIMDVKHTKKEIADSLTPVIESIYLRQAGLTEEEILNTLGKRANDPAVKSIVKGVMNGSVDSKTATDDYITTLKFAQASAMNEVLATAQSIEKNKARDAMRNQIGQELGATSAEDERGKFTHVMNSERLDADGNPYELEAVTTVKDADGNEWFYMGNQGSQVVLKKMGEEGGKPMFLTQEQYAQRVESGEYTENTQLATQYLDQRIEQQRAEEERVRKNQEVQDNYSRILAALQQNPEITVGTEDAPMIGTVAQVARDGVVVDFGKPVLLNGVTRPVHKLSLEQAGNALGIDAAMRSDEQMDRDSADQDDLNRKRISAYNNTFKDKDFTLNGDPYTFVRMFEAPYLDEDGTELVKVTATDAMGNDVELVLPLKDLEEQALTSEEQAQADADQEDVNLSVTDQTTGSLKDFRGNDIPMRQNEKTGEEEVDKREFKRRDPEAYYRWNDSRRGGNTSDSMEAIQADIAVKSSKKDKLAAQKQSETDPDTRDELEAQITNLDNEINLLSGIYHKYDAASNFQQRQTEYAQRFADIKQRMLKAKTQEQYDELVEMQRQLSMDYFTQMRDAAQTLSLNQHAVELQQALNEMADLPVQVTTYARIEEDMINDQASRASIDKVLDKIASVQRENMATGSNLAINGFHHNGKVYIFAEGNRTVADATVTYYHERQHDINETNPKAVDDVLALANNDEQALYDTLTYIIGNAKSYEGASARVLADEIVAFTMEKAWTNPNYVDELKALGLSNELINIISTEYGRQQGTSEDLNQRSGDRTSYDGTGGQPNYRIDEQAQEGESGDEQLGSSQPGNEAEEVGLTEQTQKELAEKGLVMDGGVVMASALSDLKQATGYLTPNEISPEADAVAFSIRTKNAWAANYRKYPGSEERVIRALENLAERMAADELVSGVISQGDYKYGKKANGRFAGPLLTNIEYVVTFDMDTTCPRTFQYLNYVKQIEKRIGRPLTQTECIQLTEMMRMYGQQIPCVYCYSENKRQAMKQYYTDFMTSRQAVLNAETDEEALEHMYGHGTSKAAKESKDPAVALNEAAYKVFLEWRANRKSAYNPSLKMLWFQYSNDRNTVLSVLDQLYADGRIMTDLNDDVIAAVVDTELRINDKQAVKVVEDIVSEWKWDAIEGRQHSDYTPVDEDEWVVDPRTLSLWREMTAYAKSASQAKSVLRYVPYTDELKKLSQEQKDYINGMGGVRMHSSNDFRIDYVFDYFQFMADMAANKMFGHTYTKSPEFVRIFGNSGYKINMSIAAYEDENGNIRMNEDEGFNWDEAKRLREAFPNAGVMLMATSDNQIQMALDSDWIDMFIPFHASSLPKAVWYNMRMWQDYSTVQNEAFLNGDEMKAALIADGVELPKKIKAADVEQMYLEHFKIKSIIGATGKKKGKRLRPHFLPGPTVVDGQYVPGHNNDPKLYKQLCMEYGVHPRFYGVKVKDAQGNTIDITEHPNYIKCIKETSRTDSPQTAIQFNFDQPSEALGGKSPIEYAFDELQVRAAAEMESAGAPVRDIYKSLEKDTFGIVPQFIDTIIKHKEKTGKDYPLDYITPESRKWFLTERRALEEVYKDVETIPYHRNEYDIDGEPMMRVAANTEDQAEIQKALDLVNGVKIFQEEDGDIRFSIRTKPAPKNTGIGYKVFYLKDGKLYPPMVANPDGADTPVGVWLDADAAPQASTSKTGRKKVKAGGKGTQGGSGTLAYRPGWHLGEIPYALQFNRGPKVDNPLGITGKNGKVIKVGKYFPANFVWAEVEYAKDVDYQDEAMSYGYNEAGNFQHSLAGLPKVPEDGSYTYRTNANPATDPWIITGAMKVNRILTDSEVDELVSQAGREPQEREVNDKAFEERMAVVNMDQKRADGQYADAAELDDIMFRVENNNQQIFISNALASLDKISMKSGNAQAWVNKIQQAGGLKKEEDKWLGLSDWLKASDKKTLTKQEVLDFIKENMIQIEETIYSDSWGENQQAVLEEKFGKGVWNAFDFDTHPMDEDTAFVSVNYNSADFYNSTHDTPLAVDEYGDLTDDAEDILESYAKEIQDFLNSPQADETGLKNTNATRRRYRTDGLENNREIALTVPTIEPYNAGDRIHFGDAGDGRAIAWIRFGETKTRPIYNQMMAQLTEKYGEGKVTENITPEEWEALINAKRSSEERILVIDEIQSKRHQDGKEKGYDSVPDAPFRDSWDALAMKRMLRLAAEEGYDKIAWTSGQMQSDRYDLTKVLGDFYYKPNEDGTYKVSAVLNQKRPGYTDYSDLNYDSLTVDRIGEVFGKEIAAKVSEGKGRKGYSHNDERDWVTFSGRKLKMANEGMRYFYDQKLVNWMNKYGKKWGVQVADLTLPNLENEEGWHSVDVTPEMKESVMGGQVMFRTTEQREKLFQDAKDEFGTTRDFREAGYLLPDGSMLDFSEKNNGGEPGRRGADHRDIARVINDRSYGTMTEYLDDFINEGAIRLIPESAAFSIAQQPTKEQKNVLRNFIYRYNGEVEVEIYKDGHSVADPFYRERTSPTRVLNDIDAYFADGTIPEGNAPMFRAVEITPETRDEMAQIEAIARVNGTYLKAPNGADTKLTPEQWAMVRTKAFKNWFGNWENDPENASKVVDKNGEPMVVYHGTNREFYTFRKGDIGFHFGDSKTARRRMRDVGGKTLMPVYISLKNPLIINEDLGSWDAEFVASYLLDNGLATSNEMFDVLIKDSKKETLSNNRDSLKSNNVRFISDYYRKSTEKANESMREFLLAKGYDGIKYRNQFESNTISYIVFSPNQIKSATENNGGFEPNEPDIRYRVVPGGESMAERTYRESGAFSFTGSEKISSIDDVAFIFRELQERATENSFLVLVKDGVPTILHTGIGSVSATAIDMTAAVAGYNDFKPDVVYMVHNHPSGSLYASRADRTVLDQLRGIFNGVPVEGIILDTVSGNYGVFDQWTDTEREMPESGDEFPVKVLAFDKQVFDKEFRSQMNDRKVRGAEDVAAFLSAHRLGDGDKLGVLLLNHNNIIVANYVTNDNALTGRNAEKIARQVADVAVHNGATATIMFGNFNFTDTALSKFNSAIKIAAAGEISMLDVVQMDKDGNYHSVAEGTLNGRRDGVMFRVTPAQDEEYRQAYEAGDAEKAAQMVKDAFKSAYPNTKVVDENDDPKVVYHAGSFGVNGNYTPRTEMHFGTKEAALDRFRSKINDWFWYVDGAILREDGKYGWEIPGFADFFEEGDPELALYDKLYNEQPGYNTPAEAQEAGENALGEINPRYKSIMEGLRKGEINQAAAEQMKMALTPAYLNIENPLRVEDMGDDWSKAPIYGGTDGYVYKNEYEDAGSDSYVVFKANQVKSADPFTFDDNGNLIPLSQRFNPESNDVRFRVTPEVDEAYKDAVDAGDMQMAQSLVDAAAESAMADSQVRDENGKLLHMYHGTRADEKFYVFDTFNERSNDDLSNVGSHFGPKGTAQEFSKDNLYDVYLNLKKVWEAPFDFFADNYNNAYLEVLIDLRNSCETPEAKLIFDRIYDVYPILATYDLNEISIIDEFDSDEGLEDSAETDSNTGAFNVTKAWLDHRNAMVEIMRDMMEAEGFDGISYENWYEGEQNNLCYVALYPSQIKSADAVTYDNQGNMIPLSQRFTDNDDIRFRISGKNATFADNGISENRLDGEQLAGGSEGQTAEGTDYSSLGASNDGTTVRGRGPVEVLFRMVGQEAVKNMPEEESLRAQANLDIANQMKADGKSAQAILDATGWQFGKDGKPRLEEPDFTKEQVGVLSNYDGKTGMPLKDLIDDERLFTEYPSLKDWNIGWIRGYDASASTDFNRNRIIIGISKNLKAGAEYLNEGDPRAYNGRGWYRTYTFTKEGRRSLLHELQHVIQNIEGFAPGASSNYIAARIGKHLDRIRAAAAKIAQIELDTYDTPEGRALVEAVDQKFDKETIKARKEALKKTDLFKEGMKLYDQFVHDFSFTPTAWGIAEKAAAHRPQNVSELDSIATSLYMLTSGEVEARTVEKRMDMKDDKRKSRLSSASEDVPREAQWNLPANPKYTAKEDAMFSIRQKDAVSKSMSGLQNFNDDEINDMLMDTFEAVTPEIRAKIVDNAPETGYDFGKATVRTFADLAEREDDLTAEEWNAIATLRDNMKDALGIDVLSLNDTLWSMYQTSTFGERDILSAARRAIVADKLGHSPADEAKRQQAEDELRFSIREGMESTSAAEMYNRATNYWMNRLKESYVDMNESVNDLVSAIEKATGIDAEAFEDVRLALNQQSSKGLAAMTKYTADYLEPLWSAIHDVMEATGMSYDDVVRYVMLKHAVERNDVFARRDAKGFYQAEFDNVVNPLRMDRKQLERDRKKALAAGDLMTANDCDNKIQAIDLQIAAEQKKLDRHNKMVDNGTAAKYHEYRENDYGGLTSMYSEYPGLQPREYYKTDEEYNQAARKVRKPLYQTVGEMEVSALGEVDAMEQRTSGDEFDKLWEKINAATKATLESQYKSNVISKAQYDAARDQFQYYVPLRGFKDTTAEDIWTYFNASHSGSFSPALLGARGRKSEAENPFNWIGTMASSAIAQNVKNETKMALYYFIANRPNQDLVSVKDVWYQFDAQATADYQAANPGSKKRIFTAVYPPFNESLDTDAAKQAYDIWEESMQQQAQNGLAYRGTNKLDIKDDVAFIDAKEAPQHIIRMKLRGKDVSLIINGNPRAAQAINGLLNIETEGGYQKIFGPILRWMSAVNTSYNPEFWISNMQRDLLFATMGMDIKGDGASNLFKNLVNPKKIMKMMKAYEDGTLGNSEVENYYREFAESGAITGFTVVSGNETWEKEIADFLDPSVLTKIKDSKFMKFWQDLGEAVEQMTRFSAYMAARKSGKDIIESTNAAKEITVNFNRKGSGRHISVDELKTLTTKSGRPLNKAKKAAAIVLSLIPAYGRRMIMFFNAAIQGLNAMYKLLKKNPKRFIGWASGYFAVGVMQAVLHALLDDDDDYMDMPEYTKRNNLLLGYDGIYFKWAMPQEARAFYALGDIAVNHIMGREPNKNSPMMFLGEALEPFIDVMPMSIANGWKGLAPSAMQPAIEMLTNKDFAGSRIYNDMRFLSEDERKRTPKFNNALPNTGKIFINISELLNDISGGNDWDAGDINFHPEAIQHVVEGAGGGLLRTLNKVYETVGGAIDKAAGTPITGEELSVRRFPFLNRLLEVNDERSRNSHVSELFYYYKSEAEHTKSKIRKFQKNGDSDAMSDLIESKEFEIYKIYMSYEKLMRSFDDQIKIEEDKDEKKALMRQQDQYRKDMIREISELE